MAVLAQWREEGAKAGVRVALVAPMPDDLRLWLRAMFGVGSGRNDSAVSLWVLRQGRSVRSWMESHSEVESGGWWAS
jgi:hypothetical protein